MTRVWHNVGYYMWKHAIEKKRRPILTLTEVLCPVVLVLLLVALYEVVNSTTDPDATYEMDAMAVDTIPFAALPAQLLEKQYMFGMAPSGSNLDAILQRLDMMAPALNFTQLYGAQAAAALPFSTAPAFSRIVKQFASASDMQTYLEADSYGDNDHPRLWAAVSFNSFEPKVDYSIRVNASMTDSTLDSSVNVFSSRSYVAQIARYIYGTWPTSSTFTPRPRGGRQGRSVQAPGLATIQLAMDRAILNRLAPPTNVSVAAGARHLIGVMYGLTGEFITPLASAPLPSLVAATAGLRFMPQEASVTSFPTTKFTSNPFYDFAALVFGFFFVLTYIVPVSSLIRGLVLEKETRLREGMKMMGMTNMSYNLAWIISYVILFLFIGLLVTLVTFWNMFNHSDFFLLYCMFVCFGLSCVSFCFLISAFFSRAKTAAVIGSMLFFCAFFPYFAVTGPTYSNSQKMWASLCSPTAFGLALEVLSALENRAVGAQWNSIYTPSSNITYSATLWMMLVDAGWYMLLALYVTEVMPGEYGAAQPFYFFFTRSYWFGETVHNTSGIAVQEANDRVEKPSQACLDLDAQNRCIRIHDLVKEFQTPDGVKAAVNHLNLTMYEGEVFALLGHNGAGKTTALTILSGLIQPTSGDAVMYGLSIKDDMPRLRQMMGVCPQHDVLFPELTVEEHLRFFAGLKGIPSNEITTRVDSMIAEVGLAEKRNELARSLSGGQKRKLSVGIALMGDSKIVFLDEPTSGMDPFSRRSTWNVIQNNRQGRIIILTTHFMDEADLLGDRIGIMADGTIRCCGSSMFLKSRYGVGYTFTVVKQAGCDVAAVTDLLNRHIPESHLLSNVGAEISFQIPLSASSSFGAFFRELDDNLAELKVEAYGISVTTLEEVFLKVAALGDEAARHIIRRNSQRALPDAAADAEFKAEMIDGETKDKPEDEAEADSHVRPPNDAAVVHVEEAPELMDEALAHASMFWPHFVALLQKRARYSIRDSRAICFQLAIPVLATLLAVGLLQASIAAAVESQASFPLDTRQLNVQSDGSRLVTDIPYANTAGASGIFSHVPSAVGKPVPVNNINSYVNSLPSLPHLSSNATEPQRLMRGMSEYLLSSMSDQECSRYGAFAIQSDLAANFAKLYYLVNTSAVYSPLIYLNIGNEALLKAVHDDSWSISAKNYPLPYTAYELAEAKRSSAFFVGLIFCFAYTFIPAAYVVFIVREREVAAKHQQLISGVSIPAYWVSTWVWDCTSYILAFGAAIAIIYGFDVREFTDDGAIGATVLLFLFYGICSASLVYIFSYFFRSPSNAQNFVIFVYVLADLLVLATFIMAFIEDTKEVQKQMRWAFRILPSYALGEGLQRLAFKKANNPNDDVLSMDVAGAAVLYMGVLSVVYFLLAILIDIMLSYPMIRAKLTFDPKIKDAPHEVDDDVAAEAARIERGEGVDEDSIRLYGIRKVYGNRKVAVRKLSFGVRRGECFGFLGINGAGKTTTLKILSGDDIPTEGGATLNNFDIMREQPKVRRLLGYCPQFDALFELLTVREHLELFAQIKGVERDRLAQVVNTKIKEMDLTQFENKLAGALSGGNKRKLSVAISMIGNPPLMFLDEPSTGMDPVARRFMWRVISRLAQRASIVLTTHSMEECEALCSRVGIMVSGRLRCLGSVQHLKNKFGSGYYMEVKLKDVRSEMVDRTLGKIAVNADTLMTFKDIEAACTKLGDPSRLQFISPGGSGWAIAATLAHNGGRVPAYDFARWWASESDVAFLAHFVVTSFPGSILIERHGDQCRFKLPKLQMSVGQLFETVEAKATELNIREYAISQTTLEQIFNYFAAQQEEEQTTVRGMERITGLTPHPGASATGATAAPAAAFGESQSAAAPVATAPTTSKAQSMEIESLA